MKSKVNTLTSRPFTVEDTRKKRSLLRQMKFYRSWIKPVGFDEMSDQLIWTKGKKRE